MYRPTNELLVLDIGLIMGTEFQNRVNPDGTYSCWVWNGDEDLRVGELYGQTKVVKIIHEVQKIGDTTLLDRGWKGYVTFEKKPSFFIHKNEQPTPVVE